MKFSKIKNIWLFATGIFLLSACSKDGGGEGGGDFFNGQGGSMARFSIRENILYVVDNRTLKLFDVENAAKPFYLTSRDQYLDEGVETIFTMDSLLFIGSESGMYIYNIKSPALPQRLSFTSHIRSCDPVVAFGNYAYVTLSTNATRCNRGVNELHVYDISNPAHPVLKKTEGMYSPQGLGVDGKRNRLFICDRGVKIFDISNSVSPKWIGDLFYTEANGIDAYDVIPRDGLLLLIGKDGFYQFDYSGEDIQFLSKITVEK